jgi:hypothetical protein
MLKNLATIALLIGLGTQAKAAGVAIGTITNVAVGLDDGVSVICNQGTASRFTSIQTAN